MSSFLLLLLFAFLLDLEAVPAQSAKGRQLGASCSQDRDCGVPYSRCSASQCTCQPYYARYNATKCLPSSLLGFDCLVREQCSLKVANSSCIDGMCRCEPGFLQFRRHTCLSPARPGDVCYSDAHCRLWDTDSHCRFLIPKLFGRCACNKPLILRGDTCIHGPEDLQPPLPPQKVTLSSASLWAFTTQTTTSPSSPPTTTSTEMTTTSTTTTTPSPATISNAPEATTRHQEVPTTTTFSDHFFYSTSHAPVTESPPDTIQTSTHTESSTTDPERSTYIGTEKPATTPSDRDPISSSTEPDHLHTSTTGTSDSDSQESSSVEDDSSMEESDNTDDEESEKENDSSAEEEPYGTTRDHIPSSTDQSISSTPSIQTDETVTDIDTGDHLDHETVSAATYLSTSSDSPITYTHDTSSEGTTETEPAQSMLISLSSTENVPSSLSVEDRRRIQGITESSTHPDLSVGSQSSTHSEYGNLILTTPSEEGSTFDDMAVAATSYITGHSTPRKAAVSLGMACVSDVECRASDVNSRCVNGVCDCAVRTNGSASCGATSRGCHPGTFQCRSTGACVSWFFVCDGRRDCADGSDEECDGSTECPAMSFSCGKGGGKCVSRSMRCDGNKDCPGGEDEAGCNQRTGCPAHTFACAGGGVGGCVPDYELCNAVLGCPDGSDEPVWCRVAAPYGRRRHRVGPRCPFRCDNGRCRSTAILCSGRDGCGDGSDEAQCRVCKCPSA